MTVVRSARWSDPSDQLSRVPVDRFGRKDPFEVSTRALAYVSAVVVGFDMKFGRGLTPALLMGIAFIPLLVPVPRRYHFARMITVLTLLSVPSGLWLAQVTSQDHAVSRANAFESTAILLGGLSAILLVLWARLRIPVHRITALYGLGGVLAALAAQEMDWKFGFMIPSTYLVLGLLERFRNRLIPVIAVTGLGVLGVVNEGRSYFGFCLLAATLTIVQMRPSKESGKPNRWFPAIVIAGLCLSIYFIGSALLTGGYLGQKLQERSVAQVESTGSLIAGGRPEWAATRALVAMKPGGYGLGVVPDWTDLETGKSGLLSINIDTGGYANNYMFGGAFRLHAVVSDLWVSHGLIGIALAVALLAALVRSLSERIAERRAPTSVIFACALAVWFMLFGPLYSNWTDVCFAIGIAVTAFRTDGSEVGASTP